MAVSVFKTFSADEILTASDLNSSLTQFTDNGEDFSTPATKAHDMDGNELILDSDADTSITASTDDRIDFRIAGTDGVFFGHATGNTGGFVTVDPGAFTSTAATDIGRVRVGNTAAMTIPAGVTTVAAGLYLDEPNFTATGTITNAVTLYIKAAPNEGGTLNHALWVDAGSTQLDGTCNVTGALSEATTRVGLTGKHTIWIPASAMRPTVTNGCAALTDVETQSARPDMTVLDFATGADEFAQFQVALPKMWNLGTVTAQFFWTGADTDTGGVTWAIKGVGMGNNGTIDVVFGTQVDVDDEGNGTAEVLYVTDETGAMTLGGTPADDDMSYFHVSRDVSDTNDDRGTDARLIGIKLFITTDTGNDA